MNVEELFKKAEQGDASILDDPNVSIIKNNLGNTPLHWLAYKGIKEALNHKDVSIVKNNGGWTPLDLLALYLNGKTRIEIAKKFGWDYLCKILNKSKKEILFDILKKK